MSLDLSDNEFGDDGISVLAEAFVYNQSVRFLNIDFNFKVFFLDIYQQIRIEERTDSRQLRA